ncbi:MAG: ABC transporter permease, partial [Halioglobus sp.]|nr:ABC transporter permease [Halioglobus sp.]
MTWNERVRLALRYTFAFGQGHLSAFLSSISMLGLVLAITLLIVVLSVMNGFDKEMRERILSLVPHITVYADVPITDWEHYADRIMQHPGVLAAGPFAQFDALIMRGTDIETVRGIGLDTGDAGTFSALMDYLEDGDARAFMEQPDGLILGSGVARQLGAEVGESLSLVVPGSGRAGKMGPTRFQAVQVTAILETGTELDRAIALVRLPLASRLAGLHGAVNGFRLTTDDLFDVQRIALQLHDNLPVGFYSSNWMMTHGNLYSAIQLSRDLISILLFSIIAVAAFNVVSSLVLVVLDKQG